MHHTTLAVLLLLVFGQFFVLGCAALFLWLAGEFGDPPSWRALLHKSQSSDIEVRKDAAATTPPAKGALHRVPLSPGLIGSRDDDGAASSIDPAVSDATAARRPISVSWGCLNARNLPRSRRRTPTRGRDADAKFNTSLREAHCDERPVKVKLATLRPISAQVRPGRGTPVMGRCRG
jgi:hypothetical protein